MSLVRKWSMAGAVGDLSGRFGSLVDIHALVAERDEGPSGELPQPAQAPVLLKRAGEDGWQPLAATPA